jgi:hypothetical protein
MVIISLKSATFEAVRWIGSSCLLTSTLALWSTAEQTECSLERIPWTTLPANTKRPKNAK